MTIIEAPKGESLKHTIWEMCPYMTIIELKKIIANIPDDTWVCIDGHGPVLKAESEPGANEPFIILSGCLDH